MNVLKFLKKKGCSRVYLEKPFAANIDELKTVIKFKPKRIMLDNFNIANIKKSVQIIRDNSKCQIEVSGKMTINKIKKIKYLDIDFISVGKITHSACFLDISMLVVE